MKPARKTTEEWCAGRVYGGGLSAIRGNPCHNAGKLKHDGKLYCKVHHPPSQKAKLDARDEQRRAENQMLANQRERRDAIAKAERAIIDAVMACKSEVDINTLRLALARARTLSKVP